ELHLHGTRARSEPEQLVPQTDAEDRHPGIDQLTGRGDRVVAGLRVARTVRKEHAVGPQRQRLARRQRGRHDRDATAAVGEIAQYVALDAVVVGNHVEALRRPLPVARAERPATLAPDVGRARADHLRQIHALEPRVRPRGVERRLPVTARPWIRTPYSAAMGPIVAPPGE